jgi:tetratricopeptide (TPR) repeat protein
MDPGVDTDELLAVANRAIDVFDSSGDDLGLARAWLHVAEVQWLRCHCAEVEEVLARGLVHAERAGERREISAILASMAPAALVGPRPADDAIEVCRGILERGQGSAGVEGHVNLVLAVLEAMTGRVEDARSLYAETTSALDDRGLTTLLASLRMYPGMVELIAGDYEAAERELRLGYDQLAAVGHSAFLSTTAAFLAKPLYELGRHDEALEMTRASDDAASPDDIASQVIWRGTRAKVLAHRGEAATAAELAQEAVDLLRETDLVNTRADAYSDLAETMRLLDRGDEAATARDRALELYEAKGNIASAAAILQT